MGHLNVTTLWCCAQFTVLALLKKCSDMQKAQQQLGGRQLATQSWSMEQLQSGIFSLERAKMFLSPIAS